MEIHLGHVNLQPFTWNDFKFHELIFSAVGCINLTIHINCGTRKSNIIAGIYKLFGFNDKSWSHVILPNLIH